MIYADEWQRCRPWIEAALARCGGTHELGDVEAELAGGHAQFWPGARGAAVTRIAEFPRAKLFNIWLAGGELEELLAMLPTWRRFAAFHGCKAMTITGRDGWRRALKNLGWEARAVCLSSPIAERET